MSENPNIAWVGSYPAGRSPPGCVDKYRIAARAVLLRHSVHTLVVLFPILEQNRVSEREKRERLREEVVGRSVPSTLSSTDNCLYALKSRVFIRGRMKGLPHMFTFTIRGIASNSTGTSLKSLQFIY